MFTVNIYMNSAVKKEAGESSAAAAAGGSGEGDFEGGATRFYESSQAPEPATAIEPEAGQCVVFRQPPHVSLNHDGERVRNGVKYLFRTDVMYRRRRGTKGHAKGSPPATTPAAAASS